MQCDIDVRGQKLLQPNNIFLQIIKLVLVLSSTSLSIFIFV